MPSHDQPGNPATDPGAATGPGCATQPCPNPAPPPGTAYTISCRWLDAQAYCGDNANLEVTVTPTPPNGAVRVEVLHPATGAVVNTINGNMTSGRMQGTWLTKAQTANWRTDQISFRGTASSVGLTGTSSNHLTFRQRPTTTWTLKNVTHPTGNGYAPAHEKHDVQLEADRVHYSLKFRTFGGAFNAAKQTAAKNLIQDVWNNGFSSKKFHRTRCGRGRACDCTFDCCKAGYRLDVNFVTTGEHAAIQIFVTPPGAPQHGSHLNGDGGDWGDPPLSPTTSYPHEVGHVLGQFDEYPDGAIDPNTPPAQPANATTPNLMAPFSIRNQTLLNRHYRHVLAYLNSNANGDPYEIIPPGE